MNDTETLIQKVDMLCAEHGYTTLLIFIYRGIRDAKYDVNINKRGLFFKYFQYEKWKREEFNKFIPYDMIDLTNTASEGSQKGKEYLK